jgi:hypothetical protein
MNSSVPTALNSVSFLFEMTITIAHKGWKVTALRSPKTIAKMPEAKMVYRFPQPDASFF